MVRQKKSQVPWFPFSTLIPPSSHKYSGPPTRSPPECRSKCRKMQIAHIWRCLQFQEAFRHISRYVTSHIKTTSNDLDYGHSKIQIWWNISLSITLYAWAARMSDPVVLLLWIRSKSRRPRHQAVIWAEGSVFMMRCLANFGLIGWLIFAVKSFNWCQ